jgi:4-amino-4-deoxy-L-arabinose transferase-like glycosyltransferase
VGALAGVVYALTLGPHLAVGLDALWYLLVGAQLTAGGGYSNPVLLLDTGIHRPTAVFPPGWPGTVAALHEVGLTTPTQVRLAGAVLGGVTVVLVGLAGRRLTGRPAVGLVAAAIVGLLPALVATWASLMAETVEIPLMAGVLAGSAWASSSPRRWPWVVPGALAGALVLTRSDGVLIALVLVPLTALVGSPGRRGARVVGAAVALTVSVAVVAPWVVRNETTFHPGIALSTDGAKTLAGSNCRTTYGGPLLGSWANRCVGHARLAVTDEGRFAQVLTRQADRYAEHHLGQLPLVATVRALRSWGLYAPWQGAALAAKQTRSIGFTQVATVVDDLLLLLALPGIWLVRRRRPALVLLAGPPLLATVAAATSNGGERLVLVALPSLAVAAAVTLVALADALGGRRPGQADGTGASDRPAVAERSASPPVPTPPPAAEGPPATVAIRAGRDS